MTTRRPLPTADGWALAGAIALGPTPSHAGPRAELETVAGFDLHPTAQERRFNEFTLDRAELGVREMNPIPLDYELRLESVRAAGRESITGVDGDSLVLRVKRAWGGLVQRFGTGDSRISVAARLGLVADAWVETALGQYPLRDLSPLAAERDGFFDATDLGVAFEGRAWGDRVTVRLAWTNGEGRNEIEQNRGKDTTVAVQVEAWRFDFLDAPASLVLAAGYRDGSAGLSGARDHRVTGAVTASGARLAVGAEYVRAMGLSGDADREADALGLWAQGLLIAPYWGLAVRYDHRRPVLADSTARQDAVRGATFLDLSSLISPDAVERCRLYLGAEHDDASRSGAPLAGVPSATPTDRLFLTLALQAASGPTAPLQDTPEK